MCGIAGYVGPKAESRDAAEALIARMTAVLAHRGPDGHGSYHNAPAVLGHTRLSIIDLATGDQPMTNEDGSIWVVFNGEIFNYVELRAELKAAGHVFRTGSDTEVIVHGYEQWGTDFAQHLNGQFAIALWDVRRRELLLVRDRVGIRPLFYRESDGELCFGSEIKSIFAGLQIQGRIAPRGLAEVFTFWSAVGERTIFEGVRSLPPGHLLKWREGRSTLHRYWDWPGSSPQEQTRAPMAQVAEELRHLLQDAVRLQLRADVPVGAYLSGGLDSSGLAALIRANGNDNLRTFSVTFESGEFDESAHQLEMARALGTQHSTIQCSTTDIGAHFQRLVWHAESPVLRTAPVPLMLLSGLARDSGFKVVLTGEGADEVFGGYDLFKEAKIRRFWARQPQSLARPALFRRLYGYLANSPVQGAAWTRSFFGQRLAETTHPFYAHFARWSTSGRLSRFFSGDLRAQLAGWSPEEELLSRLPANLGTRDGISRDQYVEAHTLLYGYLLSSQGDRVAMANSVEGRVPYLDHRVIEFASRLPERYKIKGLREKAILRDALAPVLPEAIVKRVKQPYRAPDSVSFFVKGKVLDYVAELLSEKQIREAGFFDPVMTAQLVEKCRTERAIGFGDNMAFVGILSTMLVHEHFAKGRVDRHG